MSLPASRAADAGGVLGGVAGHDLLGVAHRVLQRLGDDALGRPLDCFAAGHRAILRKDHGRAAYPVGRATMIRGMALSVTTDHDEITAVLDRFLAADAVSATLLGTIRSSLEATAWAARGRCARGRPLGRRVAGRGGRRLAGGCAHRTGRVAAGAARPARPDRRAAGRRRRWRRSWAASGRPRGWARGCSAATSSCRRPVSAGAARARRPARPRARPRLVRRVRERGRRRRPPDRPGGRPGRSTRAACWLWRDGRGAVVSLAARRPLVAGSARVGPVYTPPPARGHGYGSAVTAAATRSILDEGAVPVLFTDLANPTSNKIYQQIGYRPVERAADRHVQLTGCGARSSQAANASKANGRPRKFVDQVGGVGRSAAGEDLVAVAVRDRGARTGRPGRRPRTGPSRSPGSTCTCSTPTCSRPGARTRRGSACRAGSRRGRSAPAARAPPR